MTHNPFDLSQNNPQQAQQPRFDSFRRRTNVIPPVRTHEIFQNGEHKGTFSNEEEAIAAIEKAGGEGWAKSWFEPAPPKEEDPTITVVDKK